MNVIEIVEKYLKDNNYDGLVLPDAECGCSIEDSGLAPCGIITEKCRAAHRRATVENGIVHWEMVERKKECKS